jgi:diacylglycerol kinase (ATP)
MAFHLHFGLRWRVMNPKRATIIYNPMSGRPGRRDENVRELTRLLLQRGIESDARATTGPDDAARIAKEALGEGAGIIVTYGGDGTVNEVIQEMAGADAALAVWPGGTSNVVARDLGVPFAIAQIADMIAAGKTKRIALGLATSSDGETQRHGDAATLARSPSRPVAPSRYFLMMAGIGLDASIARSVNKKIKRRTGEFAYWLSGIRHFFMWHGEPFTIEVDGHRYDSAFALIGNGKGYGGGMMMTPNAKLEDPWFEVYVLPPLRNNLAYLRALRACMQGKPEVPGVLLLKGKHVVADSAVEPWVEADGEIIGPLPMTFDIVPDALSVIVP